MRGTGLAVEIRDAHGTLIWSYGDTGNGPGGSSCTAYVKSGMQQRIIDALLISLVQARAESGGAFNVPNVVPYVRTTTAQIDDRIPVS
jgi:hypothetical protein